MKLTHDYDFENELQVIDNSNAVVYSIGYGLLLDDGIVIPSRTKMRWHNFTEQIDMT